MKTILVTGGRDYDDWAMLQAVLDFAKPELIITGCANGADKMAREYADYHNIECHMFEADWEKLGKAAGPKRNINMIETYPEAIVIAFPGGKGTAHCVKEAVARNRIVLQVHK